MRWMMAALLAGTTWAGFAPGYAQNMERTVRTAGDLAQFCRMEDKAFCYGYLNGAGQFYEALVAYENLDVDPFVCPEGEITEAAALRTFLDWLDTHPDARDAPAIDGLFRAWVDAFPCD